MNTLLVVDGNNYLHRCYYTTNTSQYNLERNLLKKFVGMVAKDALKVRAKYLLIAFDGDNVFRYRIASDYKANRISTPSCADKANISSGEIHTNEVYAFLPPLLSFLNEIGIKTIHPDKYEADDVLASASAQYKGVNIVLGTRDKDCYQLIGDNTVLYDGMLEKYIRKEDCYRKFGVYPNQMVLFQSLIGDSGDNIPKIIPKNQAIAVVQNRISSDIRDILKIHSVKIRKNRKLVTLVKTVFLPPLKELLFVKPCLDKELVKELPKVFFDYCEFSTPSCEQIFGGV